MQKHNILLVICPFFLCINLSILQAQEISPIDKSWENIQSKSDKFINISLFDIFSNAPEEDLTTNISVVSDNEALIILNKISYSSYSKKNNISLKQLKNQSGVANITIKLSYQGKEYINNELHFNVYSMRVHDDKSWVAPGKKDSILILQNDETAVGMNTSTLEIINTPSFGVAIISTIKDQYNREQTGIIYTANSDVSNYSKDTIRYRISDMNGKIQEAQLIEDIHVNPYVSKVIEYMPAPGQFVNESGWGTPEAAQKILKRTGGVSLGGFGGYIILGFDQPIVNRPDNPYGVDFQIRGNSFVANLYGVWTEAGAVQVMQDKNKNGLPDDGEWYELAGSDYYFNTTKKNVEMTYYNPKYDDRYTIPWRTNKGINGAMRTNQFHRHSYFPNPIIFNSDSDSLTYSGNLIKGCVDLSSPSYIENYRTQLFGYVDNRGFNKVDLTTALNPYFNDENGNAIDGFDLDWAVDKDGNHVSLESIDFVKVYTSLNQDGGWLGEYSTEVLEGAITTPDPTYVHKDYYVHYMSIPQLKVLKGKTLQYEGFLFKNGRPSNEGSPQWSVSNPEVGSIDQNGLFTATNGGETFVRFSQKDGLPTDSARLIIVELQKVLILMEGNASSVSNDTTQLLVDERIYLTAECEDNISDVLNDTKANRYTYEKFIWTTTNPEIGTIENGLFHGLKVGKTTVFANPESRPDLKGSIVVIVNEIPSLQLRHREISIPIDLNEGEFTTDSLFIRNDKATIFLESATEDAEFLTTSIFDNLLKFQYAVNSTQFMRAAQTKETVLNIDAEYHHQTKTYQLTLKKENGVAIKSNNEQFFLLYPNPANNFIVINESGKIEIFAINGVKIIENASYNKGAQIDISQHAKGIYFVRINNKTVKLIKR